MELVQVVCVVVVSQSKVPGQAPHHRVLGQPVYVPPGVREAGGVRARHPLGYMLSPVVTMQSMSVLTSRKLIMARANLSWSCRVEPSTVWPQS